jgi:hypothetical protein
VVLVAAVNAELARVMKLAPILTVPALIAVAPVYVLVVRAAVLAPKMRVPAPILVMPPLPEMTPD